MLSEELVSDVADVVAVITRHVCERVSRLELESAAYAVCLHPDYDETELNPDPISLEIDEVRRHFIASLPPYEAFRAVWAAADFSVHATDPIVDHRDSFPPAFFGAEARILEALAAEPMIAPASWVLNLVAREIATEELDIPKTDDFIVFVWDFETDEGQIASIRASASPSAETKLESRGLLPRTSKPDNYEGALAL